MRSHLVRQAVFLVKGSRSSTARVMKITSFLLYIGCFQLGARELRGQEKITINAKAASLESILKDIRKQTGYQYLFVDQWEQEAKKVDISVTNATLLEVLDLCFKDQPFSYTIVKKMIVIKKKGEGKSLNSSQLVTVIFKGRVTNEQGEPLSGASVALKNGKRGTLTDEKGMFELENLPIDAVLTISFTGYQNKEILLKGEISLTIILGIANSILDQVKVIAYGTTTQRLNTGNVSTVTASDIEKQPVNNPLLALEGRVPGMFITQNSGLPGSGITVRIQGQNSISNGNDPLYIIDGVPYASQLLPDISSTRSVLGTNGGRGINSGNPLNYINPSDIESINVLKDADATAIYGSRGANGVVLITTKKGRSGNINVDINLQNGWGQVGRKMDLLNTRQYLDMRHEAFTNDGVTPQVSDYDLTIWDSTRSTDWQNLLIGRTSHYTDVQTTFSGGNANTQYLIGGGYHKETTVFPGAFNDIKASLHFNINSVSNNQKFRLTLSGNYMNDNNHLPFTDLTQQALQLAPDAPAPYNLDGSLNWAHDASGSASWSNPLAGLTFRSKMQTNNLVSNAVLGYRLFSGLEIKTNIGYTYMQGNDVQTSPLTQYDPATWTSQTRYANFSNDNTSSWILEPQITYIHKIANGKLTALAGSTIQQNRGKGYVIRGIGANSDLVLEDMKAATSLIVGSSTNSLYKYNALFGRLNYNNQDKYLINLTVRRDGTSRFGPANEFHNFGAAGIGWLFSKESFIQESLPFLSFGKFRISYGLTGSDQVGDYSFMDLYNIVSVGIPYQGSNGLLPTRIFSPNLAWEETHKLEGAIELGFLNDKILFNANFYSNRSANQLTSYSLPSITGFTAVIKNLNAVVQNKGWEFSIQTVNIKEKNIKWISSMNLTINRNKLLVGTSGLSAYYQSLIGHPISSLFQYHFLGVNPATGLYQVADSHGDPTTTPLYGTDNTTLIDPTPKYYGGFENSINYKGVQLDVLFQFVKQVGINYLYNSIPGSFISGLGNQPVTVLGRWEKPGDISNIQRFSQSYSQVGIPWSNAQASDLVYSDASYIRLKNLSVSWQIPAIWKQKLHLKNGRLYVQGQNLITFTHYKGLDPETQNTANLPPLRVWTAGIQLEL